MPYCRGEGRSRGAPVQARALRLRKLCHALTACAALSACGSDPLSQPIDLFHNLQGGQIAAERPPPPGAGQPYPHIGTVPAKPSLPGPAFRNALRNQLASERDQTELLAATRPVEKVIPPPPGTPGTGPAKPGAPMVPQAAGAPSEADSADAPSANATLDAADASAPAKSGAPAPRPLPPRDAAIQIVGDPVDTPGLPLVPDGPPAPASIETLATEPAPTPARPPLHMPAPAGTQVFFAPGDATLPASQTETLNDFLGHRKKQAIEITGLGEAQSDTPEGQAEAIVLALKRARAVADSLAALHVPQAAMRIAAQPYGRGAILRLLP